MIFRKDPLIKRLFLILIAGLILMGFLLIMNSLYFIKQLAGAAGIASGVNCQGFVVGNIAVVMLMISINITLFAGIGRCLVHKLDYLSMAVDQIMDGKHPVFVEEEGIFSRLESQFGQMSRRMELGFEELRKEKENLHALVTDISHQIKTPLSAIKVFNSLLLEEGLCPGEKEEFLSRTKEQIDKLEWLSEALVKISKMEVGMIRLKMQQADIKRTILAAVNEVYSRALERNIEIIIEDLQSISIYHDIKWTKEAVVNVLENAIKYSEDNGAVNISMERLETYIKIDIKDNGIGISPHEIGKVFNRFYRGAAQKVMGAEGSGIGLYLSRKIIEEQGGAIMAGSSGAGQGSRFTILLTL
ncbi:HAMP domain-containing sensor histidine kinase [Desulfoscipio sp. XC116]|uniref:sensor histidine kinase n=1 Tax=Desulfoscipio sp. XC116 TaxID=3144975 RepID=UPI00325C0947